MSSYNSVYASLAQLSVVGQANAELKKHESGVLDVFTSAFYTHEAAAFGVIRDEKNVDVKSASTVTFQPPRSFDVLHSVMLVCDLPGLVDTEGMVMCRCCCRSIQCWIREKRRSAPDQSSFS